MKIISRTFRVRVRGKVNLSEWPTKVKPFFKSKKRYQEFLEEHVEQIYTLNSSEGIPNKEAESNDFIS